MKRRNRPSGLEPETIAEEDESADPDLSPSDLSDLPDPITLTTPDSGIHDCRDDEPTQDELEPAAGDDDSKPMPPGPEAEAEPGAEAEAESTSSELSSSEEEEGTGTVVRRSRREANAFLGEEAAARAQGLPDEVSWADEEYVGLIPMLCSRCARWLKRNWFDPRAKRFLVAVNVALCVCGWSLICVGLWLYICQDSVFYGVLLSDNPQTSPFILLRRLPPALVSVGAIFASLGFVGCCGAATECVCFLAVHAMLTLACLLTQLIVAFIAAAYKDQLHANMAASLRYQVHSHYNTTARRIVNVTSFNYRVTSVWDYIQTQLSCCGSLGPADYHYSAWFNQTPDSDGSFVPASCCLRGTTPSYPCQLDALGVIHSGLTRSNYVSTQGCYAALLDWLRPYSSLAGFLIFVIDVILLVDFVSAVYLLRVVRRRTAIYSCYDYD